jgi:hypothetical protein
MEVIKKFLRLMNQHQGLPDRLLFTEEINLSDVTLPSVTTLQTYMQI